MHDAPDIAESLDTIATVESPEHVRFDYHVAGPARRALAYLIDLIVRGSDLPDHRRRRCDCRRGRGESFSKAHRPASSW